ncbi:MAPEG family protein [Antarctobacter jejuensis]|uniref:MAPEG family protein n=1 Tax=Antarctobacter jejuensis TaxID=1439938 RepID=UPI003FD2CE19
MEQFAEYGHAIAALGLTVVFGLLLSPFTALAKMSAGHAPGGTPAEDYGNRTYRFNRAYLNLTENMGFFAAVTAAAILSGANPTSVNWLAALFFVSRVLHFFVHYAGIGPANFGPRTFVFVVGWACTLGLAVIAVYTVL